MKAKRFVLRKYPEAIEHKIDKIYIYSGPYGATPYPFGGGLVARIDMGSVLGTGNCPKSAWISAAETLGWKGEAVA